MKMEKIFFAFLDELAHSKQFLKSRENDLLLTPPLLFGKIPENSGLFLLEGFPYGWWWWGWHSTVNI